MTSSTPGEQTLQNVYMYACLPPIYIFSHQQLIKLYVESIRFALLGWTTTKLSGRSGVLLVVENPEACKHRLTVVRPEAEPEALWNFKLITIFPPVSCSQIEDVSYQSGTNQVNFISDKKHSASWYHIYRICCYSLN